MTLAIRLRQWHTYIGLLIAPSVLFFAVTGALQIFNLHESHGSYRPPALLEKLSAVHKDQVFEAHDHPPPPPAPPDAAAAPNAPEGHPPGDDDDEVSGPTLALKWFFCLVSIGLVISTLIGIWMATTQTRRKGTAWILLAVGVVLPVCLLLI